MSKMKQVRPEDFDVEALMVAAREGRLFVDEKKKTVNKEQVKKDVRAYVARISPLVTRRYSLLIDELWDEIFSNDVLMDMIMPKTKARKCRKFDKYGVMRIVGVLRVKGVYEQRSDPQFDALLEQPGKDSPYRRYLGQGLEQRAQLLALRSIVETLTIW